MIAQAAILADETKLARYMTFTLAPDADPSSALRKLAKTLDPKTTVMGLGLSTVNTLGATVPGLRSMPVQHGPGIDIPSIPASLWLWLRGSDRGELYHRSHGFEQLLLPDFVVADVVDSFQFDKNRDLSGYEDGTENPSGQDAVDAAIAQDQGKGLDGGSFVAVQQWVHDIAYLKSLKQSECDDMIGRRYRDNEEFDEAPESAHVKRAAQESFSPEAFLLRRSMPWADGMDCGLMFVAFGKSFAAFEAILKRMLGHEDGTVDALFSFTQPVTGAYFWCPPVKNNKLDLSALGL